MTAEFAICDACGRVGPADDCNGLPDNGWSLPYKAFGYYSGFSDHLIGEVEKDLWLMCHDCVVTFFRTFPRLAEDFGRGHHPVANDAERSCCEFCWKGTEIFGTQQSGVHVLYGNKDGGWVEGKFEKYAFPPPSSD